MKLLFKLKAGLQKSSNKLSEGITGIFTKAKLDDAAINDFEELLIEADLGVQAASELAAALSQQRFEKGATPEAIKDFLAREITDILAPLAIPLTPDPEFKPAVLMMVGVNGNGKTTTIGKLAAQFKHQGKSVMLAAADTFRAAAVEQLQVWGERAKVPVVTGPVESDPASVAFRALEQAKADKMDILMVDTAGRLQNKANLMAELEKLTKVMKKCDPSAPHHVVQILDATTGQNALSQVQAFKDIAKVSGLIVTKLDGTAKGGIIIALAKQSQLPIHAIGVGEGIEDLQEFDAVQFAKNLLDI